MASSEIYEDLPPISRRDRELMKAQRKYLRKIYLIGNIFVAVALVQWISLKQVPAMDSFTKGILHWQQFVIWVAFLVLLIFMFFYKQIRKTSLFNAWLSAGITAEVATVILVQPLTRATYRDIIYSGGLVLILTGISVPLSLQVHEEMQLSKTYLQLWTGRYFLICSMTELLFKSLNNEWISIFVSFTVMWFISIYMLDFAKSIGSLDFYNSNKASYILLGTLLYFNLIDIFAIGIVLLTSLRTVDFSEN